MRVELDRVNFRYGDAEQGVVGVADCTLVVPSASSLAILGPSGCGKSTLLHLIAGLLHPTSGTIRRDPPASRLGRDIAFLPQDHRVDEALSARDNVRMPGCFAAATIAADTAERLLADVGLGGLADRPAATLSGGQRLRVALARTMAIGARLVLADEPTASLDPTTAGQCIDMLLKLCREQNATCLIATHDRTIAAACDEQFAFPGAKP